MPSRKRPPARTEAAGAINEWDMDISRTYETAWELRATAREPRVTAWELLRVSARDMGPHGAGLYTTRDRTQSTRETHETACTRRDGMELHHTAPHCTGQATTWEEWLHGTTARSMPRTARSKSPAERCTMPNRSTSRLH